MNELKINDLKINEEDNSIDSLVLKTDFKNLDLDELKKHKTTINKRIKNRNDQRIKIEKEFKEELKKFNVLNGNFFELLNNHLNDVDVILAEKEVLELDNLFAKFKALVEELNKSLNVSFAVKEIVTLKTDNKAKVEKAFLDYYAKYQLKKVKEAEKNEEASSEDVTFKVNRKDLELTENLLKLNKINYEKGE